MKKELVVGEGEAQVRLDKLVSQREGLSRAQVKRLFDEGHVRVGRRKAAKGELLPSGTTVTIELPDVQSDAQAVADASPSVPLVVLLERGDVVVVDKPSGQPSAPLRAGETGTLANALVGRFPEMAGVGFSPREPGLVHRLDNDTSGVVVAARSEAVFDELVAGLREGRLDKRYVALCHDGGLSDEGTIEVPLAPHPKDKKRVLACLHPADVQRLSPRPATTSYRVLSRVPGYALVELSAPRALRHQIRSHLSAIGCPIAGDVLYGSELARERLGRQALHASLVTWKGSKVVPAFSVEAPLPADIERLAEELGLSRPAARAPRPPR